MSLVEFLLEANKKTYASGSKEYEVGVPDDMFGFDYPKEITKNGWKYEDRYTVFNNGKSFRGSILVTKHGEKRFFMNYDGTSLLGDKDKNFAFLRTALMQMPEAYPFRGPEKFRLGDYLYENDVPDKDEMKLIITEGKEFSGEERILVLEPAKKYFDVMVYRGRYYDGFFK
jgi:hypothetical protein